MSAQLAFLYNNHRTSTSPFRSVLFTRLEGKLKSRLQDSYWQTAKGRWRGVECWDGQEMDGLWNEEGGEMWTSAEEEQGDGGLMEQSSSILKSAPIEPEAITTGEYDSSMQQTLQASDTVPPVASSASISAPTHPHPLIGRLPSRSPRDSVIYLTADSPNEITELEEGMTYVIGGIVDHNRYKVCRPYIGPGFPFASGLSPTLQLTVLARRRRPLLFACLAFRTFVSTKPINLGFKQPDSPLERTSLLCRRARS